MIDKTYQPNEVEGRIYKTWEAAGAFRAGRPERARAKPYTIVIPPPNVTAVSYTHLDVYKRQAIWWTARSAPPTSPICG